MEDITILLALKNYPKSRWRVSMENAEGNKTKEAIYIIDSSVTTNFFSQRQDHTIKLL